MKNFLVVSIILITSVSFGQRRGYIEYSVSAKIQDSTFDAILSSALMNKSEFNFMFKGKNKSRMQMKAGTYFDFISIFNYKKGRYLRLISDQKNKGAQTGDIVDFPDSLVIKEKGYELQDDTMTILGFLCKKAVLESKNGELVCWYTEELDHTFENLAFINVDVPGLPLFFMTSSADVLVTFEAVKFEKRLGKRRKLLKMKIPDGYSVREEKAE